MKILMERLAIKSKNLNNGSFFNEILINSNYVGEKIELSNSKLLNKKIGSLNLRLWKYLFRGK